MRVHALSTLLLFTLLSFTLLCEKMYAKIKKMHAIFKKMYTFLQKMLHLVIKSLNAKKQAKTPALILYFQPLVDFSLKKLTV